MTDAEFDEMLENRRLYFNQKAKEFRARRGELHRKYMREFMKKYRQTEKGKQSVTEATRRWQKNNKDKISAAARKRKAKKQAEPIPE